MAAEHPLPLDDEVGIAQMTRLISEEVGFEVDRECVMKAARQEKITSRYGRRRRRIFQPAVVLEEVRAGRWRPHRPPVRYWVICANEDCTCGDSGERWEGWKPRAQVERAKHAQTWTDDHGRLCAGPMPCSRVCAPIVMRARRRKERISRRCEGRLADGTRCTSWLRVTEANRRKLCDNCKKDGRRTAAQLATAQRMGVKFGGPKAGLTERAAALAAISRSPKGSASRATRFVRSRYGREPTEAELHRWSNGATSRAIAASEKGAARREASRALAARLVALVEAGATVTAAAKTMCVTPRYARQLLRASGADARPAGRPAKK